MITNKMFTVILSACQDKLSESTNRANHTALFHEINMNGNECYQATGYYLGNEERSVVVFTNCPDVVKALRKTAFNTYNQECILISFNKMRKIELHYQGDKRPDLIGHKFITGVGDGDNYTILNGQPWSVAAC